MHWNGCGFVWVAMCLFTWDWFLKCLLQTGQENGFSPECTRICSFSRDGPAKHLSHWLHLFFFWEWEETCAWSWNFRRNDFGHWSQEKGLLSVISCVATCLNRVLFSAKFLSQWGHWYGRSPVWYLLWIFKRSCRLKLLSQMSHVNGLSPVWILLCSLMRLLLLKMRPQTPHGNFPVPSETADLCIWSLCAFRWAEHCHFFSNLSPQTPQPYFVCLGPVWCKTVYFGGASSSVLSLSYSNLLSSAKISWETFASGNIHVAWTQEGLWITDCLLVPEYSAAATPLTVRFTLSSKAKQSVLTFDTRVFIFTCWHDKGDLLISQTLGTHK